jgi:pyruvate formate lyase activating enzyme
MLLAGLQKNSFIDFPGKIGCALFVTGCNFACPYCHNPELARGEYPQRIPQSRAIEFLKSRQGMLEGVTITGGEPTLSNEITALCQTVKALGYKVKLDTNGSRPEVIRQLLAQHVVDFIAMDIKAPLNDYDPFCSIPDIHTKLAASIRIIMECAPAYEFRTTCAAPLVNAAAVHAIARSIRGAASYVLQSFNRQAVCLDAAFGRDHDPTVSPKAMQGFKALADPYVSRCSLR